MGSVHKYNGSTDNGEFDRALHYALLQLGTPSIMPKPEQRDVFAGGISLCYAVVADRHKRHTQEPATFCILDPLGHV